MSVKVSASLTIFMFVSGFINSVLSFLAFYNKEALKVGCGVYLLASSITSLLTISMLTFKFWFLILTQISLSVDRLIFHVGCVSIEVILKLFLYMDGWLNVCVGIERAVTVFKGVKFNKTKSKRIACWITLFLPLFIMSSLIHESLKREVLEDNEEQRLWCVMRYSRFIHDYNTTVLLFHVLIPFFGNLFSALFIIFTVTRQRANVRKKQTYKQHLREQLNEHKQLIISPIVLAILSLPRLIISMLSSCVKVNRTPWLYLSGYFTSFIPPMLTFEIFVLPSEFYKKQFKKTVERWRKWIYRR